MIGLLIPAEGLPEAVEFERWDATAWTQHLVNPRTVPTWRDFRLPGAPGGRGRLFYDREYWAGGRLLPRNESATRLVGHQLGTGYVPRSALVLRTSLVGNRGSRKLESLSAEDVLYLVAQLVLGEQQGLTAPRQEG